MNDLRAGTSLDLSLGDNEIVVGVYVIDMDIDAREMKPALICLRQVEFHLIPANAGKLRWIPNIQPTSKPSVER